MKKLILLTLCFGFSLVILAQDKSEKLFMLLEFMQVEDHNNSAYWEIETFWSEIHKQRIADGTIIGWDLWALTPSGSKQGSQFMTVTLFPSFQALMQGIPGDKFDEYLKKAHPDKSDNDLEKIFAKVSSSRDIAHQLFVQQISYTESDFKLKVGTIMTMDAMKQTHSSYEKMENEIFQPWHQELVNKGEKGSWGLIEIIYPKGNEVYATHITYSMYENLEKFAQSMENSGGEMDIMTQLAVQEGLKTREWKEQKLARLVMMVR